MNHVEILKDEFLEFATKTYPVPAGKDVGKHQWRDIIKTFAAGYFVALISLGESEQLIPFMKTISDYNWWPDESWKWWK
jgi:hypothetical protein